MDGRQCGEGGGGLVSMVLLDCLVVEHVSLVRFAFFHTCRFSAAEAFPALSDRPISKAVRDLSDLKQATWPREGSMQASRLQTAEEMKQSHRSTLAEQLSASES